jgi:hypothetical protein
VFLAAFLVTALAAGAGGYLVRDTGGVPALADAAGPTTAPTGTGDPTTEPDAGQALDAKAVFDRLVGQGLPIANPVPVDDSTDPNELLGRPGGYTSRLSFSLPCGDPDADQYGIGRGGIIEVFATASDAGERLNFIRSTDRRSRHDERQYRAGPVLVRLADCVNRSLANEFEGAVQTLGLDEQ